MIEKLPTVPRPHFTRRITLHKRWLALLAALALVACGWFSGAIPHAAHAVKQGTVYRYHQSVSWTAWPYIAVTEEGRKLGNSFQSLGRGLDTSTRKLQVRSTVERWKGWSVARRYRYLRAHPHAMVAGKALLAIGLFLLIFFVAKFLRRWIFRALGLPLLAYTAYRRQKPTDAHGSAQWATPDTVKTLAIARDEPRFVLGTYKPVGSRRKPEERGLSLLVQNQHVIIVGPPGTLKTNAAILRNLLCEDGNRSVVITDYKGELRELAFGHLYKAFKGRVYIYDPYDPRFDRYNPMDFIRSVSDAQRFAKSIITNTGESRDEPFWQNVNQAMIVGAVMHLKRVYDKRSVPLADLANFLSRPIQDIVKDYEHSPNDVARERAHYLLNEIRTNEKLRASVTTELTIRWDWLLEPSVRQSSAESTIPLDELSTKPMCVFLMLNAEKSETLRPLMSNLWAHIFSNIAANARADIDRRFLTAGGLEPEEVYTQGQTAFYLDEFTNIGSIPHFSDHMKTLRSAKASLFIVVQILADIDNLYGRDMWEFVWGVCATKVALGGISGRDATFISRELGDTTVVTRSSSRSRRTSELVRGQAGHTLTETKRALMEAIEIREKDEKLVVITAGKQSMLLDKDPYFNHSNLVKRTKTGYRLTEALRGEPPPDPGLKWQAQGKTNGNAQTEGEHNKLPGKVAELAAQNLSVGTIAQQLGIEHDAVLDILRDVQREGPESHQEIGDGGNVQDVLDQSVEHG